MLRRSGNGGGFPRRKLLDHAVLAHYTVQHETAQE
jgi:hypothetical protein